MKALQLTHLAPIAAILATAYAIWKSSFFTMPFESHHAIYSLGLFVPFAFAVTMISRALGAKNIGALIIALVLTGFLIIPAVACIQIEFGEGCQYILALAPIYLWLAALVGCMVSLGMQALTSRRRSA